MNTEAESLIKDLGFQYILEDDEGKHKFKILLDSNKLFIITIPKDTLSFCVCTYFVNKEYIYGGFMGFEDVIKGLNNLLKTSNEANNKTS